MLFSEGNFEMAKEKKAAQSSSKNPQLEKENYP